MDHTKAALAAGIAGGYLMGRNRKAKLAFALATYVVGRRFPLTPRSLVGEGARRLREHPRYGEISERVSEDLLAAGRNAVTAATTARLDSLSDALRQGAQALEEAAGDAGAGPPHDAPDEGAPDRDGPDGDGPDGRAAEHPRPEKPEREETGGKTAAATRRRQAGAAPGSSRKPAGRQRADRRRTRSSESD